MRIKCLVRSDDSNQYEGKRGTVKFQQVALMDMSEPFEAQMINTFDYRLSDAEKELYAGKLGGKILHIDVKDWEVFNSRLRVKQGKIVEVEGLKVAKAA